MQSCVQKLIEIASAASCDHSPLGGGGRSPRAAELQDMLERKNGFFAFESALHVFPACVDGRHESIDRWNRFELWKSAYSDSLAPMTCFAENIFGDQFAIMDSDIVSFDSESGEVEVIASSIDDWACQILVDYEFMTGYALATEWQKRFGPIRQNERLVPKMPFILGGDYSIDNLYVSDSAEAMRAKGDLYRQTRDLPDGSRARLIVR